MMEERRRGVGESWRGNGKMKVAFGDTLHTHTHTCMHAAKPKS